MLRTRRAGQQPPVRLLLTALFTGACAAFTWTTVAVATPVTQPVAAPRQAVLTAQPASQSRRATPVFIEAPAIGLAAAVDGLGVDPDGTLTPPQDGQRVGWYADGVAPGERGPAVLVGHRDFAETGPAVFYRLPDLTSGDRVTITKSTGASTSFVVDDIRQVAKTDFPTQEVYGSEAVPVLRLITCAGAFDLSSRNYEDNLIVTAHEAQP